MTLTVITPPDGEALSLDAAKDYLRIGTNGEDAPWGLAGRGAVVVESWAFPDAANPDRFTVEVDTGICFGGRFEVAVPSAIMASGMPAARVAETGAEGRVGPWIQI
tara:strand:+ start:172601 stop:172918 length:318 start_codon:yes stop_codon:yes gene_type:complete